MSDEESEKVELDSVNFNRDSKRRGRVCCIFCKQASTAVYNAQQRNASTRTMLDSHIIPAS
jgi:hypothetical protein